MLAQTTHMQANPPAPNAKPLDDAPTPHAERTIQRIQRMVAAVTRMQLLAVPADLAVLRSALYRECGRALQRTEAPVYHTPCEREGDAVTWRPAACVDVCLLPNARGDEMLVALLLESASHDAPQATLFSTCEPLPVPAPGVAYLAHMTVDRTRDGGQTVVLVYDSFVMESNANASGARACEDCTLRYNRVQAALHCWQGRPARACDPRRAVGRAPQRARAGAFARPPASHRRHGGAVAARVVCPVPGLSAVFRAPRGSHARSRGWALFFGRRAGRMPGPGAERCFRALARG